MVLAASFLVVLGAMIVLLVISKKPSGKVSGHPESNETRVKVRNTEDAALSKKPPDVAWENNELFRQVREELETRVATFRSLAADSPEKVELYRELAGNSLLTLSDVFSMANSLSGQRKSVALVMISDRCAAEDPSIYFQILDSFDPGEFRSKVIQSGTYSLDVANLDKLVSLVLQDRETEEIETLSAELRTREMTSNHEWNETARLAKGQQDAEIKASLFYSLGANFQAIQSNPAADDWIESCGKNEQAAFQEGKLRKLIENRDDQFPAELLASSSVNSAIRKEIVGEWAGSVAMNYDLSTALEKGKGLDESEFKFYCENVARVAIDLDSMVVSKAIAKMPPCETRDVVVSKLVECLEKNGDHSSADQWRALLPKQHAQGR